MLKKGPICDEDIENIIHDIGDPEDKEELLKILGLVKERNVATDEVNGFDSVDGAKPSVCNPVSLLAAVQRSTLFTDRQTNVVLKHLLDKPGKLN